MSFDRTEAIILHNLMHNREYAQKFLPHLKPELFQDRTERNICEEIGRHFRDYGHLPTAQAVVVGLGGKGIAQEDYDEAKSYLEGIADDKPAESLAWLEDETAKFIRRSGIENGVLDLVKAVSEQHGRTKAVKDCLREIEQADCFTLDSTPGLELEWETLFDYLQAPEEKFPFETEALNRMTCGGPSRKTVAVVVAPTNTTEPTPALSGAVPEK